VARVAEGLAHPAGLEVTLDEREAADKLAATKMSHDTGLLIRAYTEYDTADGWIQASRSDRWMTKDQVRSFYEDYQALVWKYVTPAGQHPEACAR
jgi:hypothetical protein